MAIIYTYPTKATPVLADLVLITDTESTFPDNQTKTATLSSLKTTLGVRDIDASSPLQVTFSTGTATISSQAFGGGSIIGYVPSSAAADQNTTFLRADGTWAAPSSGTPGNGTVTNVAALTLGTSGTNLTSTVASPTSTPVITLNVPDASGSARGALTSTDWTTFNEKQAALVSGTNIKTINNTSLLGSGNISVTATSAGSSSQIQYNNGSNGFAADAGLTFADTGTYKKLSVGQQGSMAGLIEIDGADTTSGTLRLYCPSLSSTHYFDLIGPDHQGGSSYSVKVPNTIAIQTAYSSGGRILESDANGTLKWIATPTSGSGGGISFSGSTANGLATYTNATTATVNAQVRLLSSGQMTFDAAGSNVGIIYDTGSKTLQVGDIGGNNENVEIHSNGAAKITVEPTLTTSAQITQFTNGIRFGGPTGETLNSYEEGTWTPTSTNAGNTISNASGNYVKIGNKVFAEFAFTMTGATTLAINGLPFAAAYQTALKGGVIISGNNCGSVQGQIIGGQITNTNTFTFKAYNGSGTGLPSNLYMQNATMYQTSGGTYAGVIIYTST